MCGWTGHIVVGVVLPLGAQDLALGVVGAKVGVAVGHAGHAVGGAHELQVVEVAQDDVLTVGEGGGQGEALGAVGGAVGHVQGQLVRLAGELDGLVLLGVAGGLGDGVPCRPACPGGLGARRKALCKPISKKARTCACSGGGAF